MTGFLIALIVDDRTYIIDKKDIIVKLKSLIIAALIPLTAIAVPAQASSLSSLLSSSSDSQDSVTVVTGDMLTDNIRSHTPQGPYNRDFFGSWLSVTNPNSIGWGTDPDHEGCDVREALLIDYGMEVTVLPGCEVVSGVWEDVYTTGSQPGFVRSEFHVDHVVPLAQAWRTGADRYDDDTLKQIANDKDNLILTSASTNRSKGDASISAWFPQQGSESYCEYAQKYAITVDRYNLAITQSDYDQITRMYRDCGLTL